MLEVLELLEFLLPLRLETEVAERVVALVEVSNGMLEVEVDEQEV